MRIFIAFIAALISGAALAGSLSGTISAPTTNTDGSSIPATGAGSLTGARVEYGTCATTGTSPTFGTKAGEISLAPTATTYTIPNLNLGTYCVRGYWRNSTNESVASNAASGTVLTPTPNPGTLTVTTPVAFKMRQSIDGFLFVSIGTVPVGTPCDPSHSVDGKYLVPRAEVTLASRFDTMPLVVFATCG